MKIYYVVNKTYSLLRLEILLILILSIEEVNYSKIYVINA